jgi:hypothetical protein
MLPFSPDELREVVREVGYAVWQIQILESTVGAYLVLVHKASLAVARSEVEAMFAEVSKSTLGQLLRAIEATDKAPQRLVEELDSFVPKRNWLIHRSRHETRQEMYSAQGRAMLIQKIAAIADESLTLAKAFQAETEAHLETLGISKEQIERDTAKILSEWAKAV